VDGLPYPPAPAYDLHPPTEGAVPTYKSSSGLVMVMVGDVCRGMGSFSRHRYLMEDLSSSVPSCEILHIVNGFLLGGAYPLAVS
jgi:hypothetical protein